MPLVNITHKPVALQGFQLTSQLDMMTALDYLTSRGYSGGVNSFKQNAAAVWQMSLVADSGGGSQIGNIGDWIIIENDTVASIVPASKAGQLYSIA